MNSLIKIAALAGALAAVTLPLKFIEQSPPLDDVPAAAGRIERFLRSVSETPLTRAPFFRGSERWTGWNFSVRGCAAAAFPSPSDGWLLERARVMLEDSERIFLVFEGKAYDSPPRLANAWNVASDQLLVPFGLPGRQDRLMILIIAPEDCGAAIQALDWPARLQSGEGGA